MERGSKGKRKGVSQQKDFVLNGASEDPDPVTHRLQQKQIDLQNTKYKIQSTKYKIDLHRTSPPPDLTKVGCKNVFSHLECRFALSPHLDMKIEQCK